MCSLKPVKSLPAACDTPTAWEIWRIHSFVPVPCRTLWFRPRHHVLWGLQSRVCVCVGEWLYLLCFIQGNVKDFQLWVISKKDNVPYPLIGQWVESAAVVHSRPSVCHSNCSDPPREYKGQFPHLSLSLSQVMSFPSVSRWVMCYRHCLSGAKAGTLLLRLWTDRSPCRWNSSRRTSIASSSSSLVPQTRCPYLRVSFIPGFLI